MTVSGVFSRKLSGRDFAAGVVVFLVSLPLCLGIAAASGVPLPAGIISAIIAGVIVSWMSGSELSVSGPAASMAVVVASMISLLGSWSAFLMATILAGLFQMLFSRLRAGSLAAFFPNSVIKGMMAAIGFTLIFKQIPHALGWDNDYEGDESFVESVGQSNTFLSLFESLGHHSPAAVIVSVVSALALVFWSYPPVSRNKYLQKIPATLIAVMAGTGANLVLRKIWPSYAMYADSGHLVNLPDVRSATEFFGGLSLPAFGLLADSNIWVAGLTLAVVASLETLLSVEAVDRMDPERRVSDGNRELFAQGVGNFIAGIAGGLIMTSVITRSSANVYAGATSRWSSFFHGVLFILAVLFGTTALNEIPLASLAVVLIFVGYKLVSPAVFRSVWNPGSEQFLPFIVTIVAVVLTDLLTGVGIGLCVAFYIIIRMNQDQAITVVNEGNLWLIRFAKDVSFAHKGRLRQALAEIPEHSQVIINGSGANFIDFDILEELRDFMAHSESRHIHVVWKQMRSKRFSIRGNTDGQLQEPAFGQ